MKQVQLIQVTPEELQEAILNGVKHQLEILKKEFQPKQPDEYLTIQEVANYFKVDKSTVHRWAGKGYIARYGIGNQVRFKRSEIESSIIPLNRNHTSSHAC